MASLLVCVRCKTSFRPRRSDARYCSPACGSAARRERAQSPSQPRTDASGRRSTALTSAFTRASRTADRTPADAAAYALARMYARTLDANPRMIDKLGPQYLSVLEQLGMTPKSRGGNVRGDQVATSPARAALAQIRDRRVRRAANMDTSAPTADS